MIREEIDGLHCLPPPRGAGNPYDGMFGNRGCMGDLSRRLKDLDTALQRLASAPNVVPRDTALIEEAQHACSVGIELLLSDRIVQARYACFYGEACVAMVESDECSTSTLRGLLEELLQAGTRI